MTKRDVNPIDVVEAAYDLDASNDAWLRQLATTIRPLLDGGGGLIAYTFDATAPVESFHSAPLLFDLDAASLPDFQQWAQANPEFTRSVHTSHAGLLSMSDLARRAGVTNPEVEMPHMARHFQRVGVCDYIALQTTEPSGHGVVFAAGQRQPRALDAAVRRLWARVAVHIAAGRRLRTTTAAVDEAVLTPSGKLEHADGQGKTASARAALREAVRRVETARGKQRKADPKAATEAWTALVSGRWSLVDRYERGGRRYIIARPNEHALPDPRALTSRERAIVHLAARGYPNKLIAYELGLAESTIGGHLSHAMRKLRVKTRVELIQLITGLAIPPET